MPFKLLCVCFFFQTYSIRAALRSATRGGLRGVWHPLRCGSLRGHFLRERLWGRADARNWLCLQWWGTHSTFDWCIWRVCGMWNCFHISNWQGPSLTLYQIQHPFPMWPTSCLRSPVGPAGGDDSDQSAGRAVWDDLRPQAVQVPPGTSRPSSNNCW